MGSNGTSANGVELTPLRIVVGSDNAGHTYKQALKDTLQKHKGVVDVLDVGVVDADDVTAYPHLAVDACKKIKAGEVGLPRAAMLFKADDSRPTGHFSSVAQALVLPSPPTKSKASVQLRRTTRIPSSEPY